MTYGKVVGIGENITVFGRLVKHLAMASYSCHLCEPPVLTKHAVATFNPNAIKQQ